MLLLLACATPPSGTPAVSPLGTYDGSLLVSADTPTDFCARWDRITGDLSFDGVADTASFSCLEDVGGTLTVAGAVATDLTGLGLVRTTGGLHLSMPGEDLRGLEGLEQVNGDVEIDGDVASLVGLGALRQVVGSLRVHDAPRLTTLDGLDGLWIVGGELSISDNPALVTVDGLDGLSFAASLLVEHGPVANLGALDGARIEDALFLGRLPALAALPALAQWPRVVKLESIAIPDLRGMESAASLDELSLTSLDALTSLQGAENLSSVDGQLVLNALPALGGLDGFGSIFVRSLWIHAAALTTLEPLRLRGGEQVTLWELPELADLAAFAGRDTIGSLTVMDLPSLVTPTGLESVVRAEAIGVWDAAALVDLQPLAALQHVEKLELHQTGVPSLAALVSLTAVDSLLLTDNPSLTQIDLPGDLGALNGDLRVTNNPQLRWIDALRSVDAVDGDVIITLNPQLPAGDVYAVIDAIGAGDVDGHIHVVDNGP